MKNLTGRGQKTPLVSNPFADESPDSSSSHSTPSIPSKESYSTRDAPSNSTTTAAGAANVRSARGSWGTAAPDTMGPTSGLTRYPIRVNSASVSQYGSGGSQRSTSTLSSPSRLSENEPFLAVADSSPFGGYPPSDFLLDIDEKEADDYLHNPDPIADAAEDRRCHPLDRRGWGCLVAFCLLIAGCIAVFIVLPIIDYTGSATSTKVPAPSDGISLSPYKYGVLSGLRYAHSMIDPDTPEDARTHKSLRGDDWSLVFSDEFNTDGRTFYPGDDPVWEAADMHYQATTDLEWYDPDAAYTSDGTLKLRFDAFPNHDLYYRSAMLQSWNKLCFTQGYIEVGARLPGSGSYPGLWPGLWTMGNLARPGYLASSDGVWPYGYNECDAGITANQSTSDGLSYLPGQRLNKCTCNGEDHPNPGVGRGAPEIDIIEGTVSTPQGRKAVGTASQSLQLAPMDIWYMVDYDFIEIYNHTVTEMNTWAGGPLQQAISAASYLNPEWYQLSDNRSYQRYAYEYLNSHEDGYISWFVGEDRTFTMYVGALSPNGNVGWREISQEPMSIVMNLGMSPSWTYIDWIDLVFPVVFEIDYVRIYQPPDALSLTCDPEGYPTSEYINNHPVAYQNANMTSWSQAGYDRPRNKILDGC